MPRFRFVVASAYATLSRSRCYGYVLSLPTDFDIGYLPGVSVTGFCEIRTP